MIVDRAGRRLECASKAPLRRDAADLERAALFLGPLDRKCPRCARRIEARIEAAAVPELFVSEELRLDAVRTMIAELAEDAIAAEQELEQPFAWLRPPRRPADVAEKHVVGCHR
jgi:hypothetical protein